MTGLSVLSAIVSLRLPLLDCFVFMDLWQSAVSVPTWLLHNLSLIRHPHRLVLPLTSPWDWTTTGAKAPPQVNPSSSADSLIYKNIHPRVPIIKRIPRAFHYLATQKFCSLLEGVVKENSLPSWERLLSFTSRSLFTLCQEVRDGPCPPLLITS